MTTKPIVQKYGGTSVATTDHIMRVAERIVRRLKRSGQPIAVVVSAMGKTTDQLAELAEQITQKPDPREYDMLLTTGEQVTISLLVMALHELGQAAESFTGAQAGIFTDDGHGCARIVRVDPVRVKSALDDGKVAVVAGFQGLGQNGEITTLGRGGSDTTAVALAEALGAEQCEIYTDVEGVYSGDPRHILRARKLDQICYDEMLELASVGARVLHNRSVEYAKKHGVKIIVRSSFTESPGTLVSEEVGNMESVLVRGVALTGDEARVNIEGLPDRPGVASRIFETLANESVNVDMIVQSVGHGNKNDISFTVDSSQLRQVLYIAERVATDLGADRVTHDENIAKVSVVGVGMRTHSGVAAKMFKALADAEINIQMISTSEIKISCVVEHDKGEKAAVALHTAFGLDTE
ncbi:MAG: aspartate kinase [Candidatus Hydrogenedentes bacterium]|nr:aspartate kinase [Candidatus Hydrogenedentota bacterium]